MFFPKMMRCHSYGDQFYSETKAEEESLLVPRWLTVSSAYKSWQSIMVSHRAVDHWTLTTHIIWPPWGYHIKMWAWHDTIRYQKGSWHLRIETSLHSYNVLYTLTTLNVTLPYLTLPYLFFLLNISLIILQWTIHRMQQIDTKVSAHHPSGKPRDFVKLSSSFPVKISASSLGYLCDLSSHAALMLDSGIFNLGQSGKYRQNSTFALALWTIIFSINAAINPITKPE